jgi:RNA polymerase sigma-70 factor, ECF subfamily
MTQADLPTAEVADVPSEGADGESRLLDGLRRGDPAAANDLVERYTARGYRLALAITRNVQDAEEVVQDALWNVLRSVDSFRGEAALGSWFYRIVANAACQKMRRTARHRADISLDDVLPRFHEDGASAIVDDWSGRLDDPAVRGRVRAGLTAAIDELSPEYRAVVLLRDVEGLTLAEAAAAMGITVANAKSRLHRARLFLRKRLAGVMADAA